MQILVNSVPAAPPAGASTSDAHKAICINEDTAEDKFY